MCRFSIPVLKTKKVTFSQRFGIKQKQVTGRSLFIKDYSFADNRQQSTFLGAAGRQLGSRGEWRLR